MSQLDHLDEAIPGFYYPQLSPSLPVDVSITPVLLDRSYGCPQRFGVTYQIEAQAPEPIHWWTFLRPQRPATLAARPRRCRRRRLFLRTWFATDAHNWYIGNDDASNA